MSKYIRTTDGIYEVQKNTDALKKYMSLDTDYIKYNGGIMVAYNVVKKADKIEDLCDERIMARYFPETKYIVYEILPKRQWDMIAKSISARLRDGVTDCNLYGAIWTDKGLIHVAKLNAKGEFELCER